MATRTMIHDRSIAGHARSCPSCADHQEASDAAQRRIQELEAEVALFAGKVSTLVDRINDYEDEISKLHKTAANTRAPSPPLEPTATAAAAIPATVTSKFSYFLRKPTSPALPDPATPTLSTTAEDLQKALDEEKLKRQEAETQVTKISGELDELSAVLFQQANEMVATERRARDKLEKRVAELEQKDKEKMVRLANIEKAVDRINRVRGLLGPRLDHERG